MVIFDTGGSRGIGSWIVVAASRSAHDGINGKELRVNGALDWAP